jgi:hypothetical protein
MQKIQSYLYPNRIIVTADLAGFTTEYKNVYQRTVKIYQGVDNVIEFDIKNADQKRVDLTTLSNLQMNVMDQSGNALPHSPYTVSPFTTVEASATNATIIGTNGKSTTTTITIPTSHITGTFLTKSALTVSSGIVGSVTITGVSSDIDSLTTTLIVTFLNQTIVGHTNITLTSTTEHIPGISTATIPAADLEELSHQFFNYSLTAVKGTGPSAVTIPLYVDSRFGAVGRIEFITNAVPQIKKAKIFDRFSGEINYLGNVIEHSSVVATKNYEAVAETLINFDVDLTNFIGQLYLEGTEDSTISVNSFTDATKIALITYPNVPGGYTGTATFDSIPIGTYNYIRVSWTYPDVWQYGAQLTTPFGTVDKITTNFGTAPC